MIEIGSVLTTMVWTVSFFLFPWLYPAAQTASRPRIHINLSVIEAGGQTGRRHFFMARRGTDTDPARLSLNHVAPSYQTDKTLSVRKNCKPE